MNSPTYTESTDEPTPLNLFTAGKNFKFNNNIDELDTAEGIGFDEASHAHNQNNNGSQKQMTYEDSKGKSKIFGQRKSLFRSWFDKAALTKT